MINSERLCHLQTEVADKAYQLYEAVAILADEATAEDDLPETIEQIIIYVQEVADGADAIELTGLKRVCELTQESLFELAIEDQVKRLELCQVVEQWPRLVVHYLQAMDNADCSHQFLNYLQNQCWQRPLAEDEAVVLIAELTGQQSITDPFEVQAVETISKIAQSTEIIEELAEVDLEEIAELDKSISELEITESTEIPEELTAIPLEEIAELDESIPESEFTESTEISEELTEVALEEISELDESVSESEFTESTEIPEELAEVDLEEITEESTENSLELNKVVSAEPSETTSALPSNAELDKMLDEATFDIANEEEELESVEHQEEDIFSEDESFGNADLSKNDSESQDLSEIEEDMIFSDDALADSESELMIAEDELQLKEGEKENIIFEDSVNFQKITESQKEEMIAEAPVTLEPSKILLELSEKIAEIEAILADTFRKFVALEEENEIFLESVEKYTNTLQLLWEFFAERNLSGLQEVCTFINDNFFELSSQSQSERQSLRARFLLWPQLVLDYLHAPDQKSTTLVEFLQDNQWPLPLLKKQTNNLLVQLVQDAVVLQTKSGQSKFESMTELRAESLAKPQQVTIAESVAKREKAVAQQATATQEKSSKAAKKDEKVFSFDLAASSSTKTEMPLKSDWESAFVDEDVLLASESKENDLLLFSEEFENSQAKNKLPTEKPIDLEYSENLDKTESIVILNDQEVDLDGFDETQEIDHSFSDEETVSFLEEDIITIEKSSVESDAEVLVEDLFTEEVLSEDEATLLTESFVEDSEDETTQWVQSETQLVNVEIFDSLQVEIAEATKDLTLALTKLVTAPEGSEALLEAVEQYTDNVQSIYDAAQQLNLIGLQEICAFINNNLFELSLHPPAIRRTAQPILETWLQRLQQYLHSPVATAPQLVALLRQPIWPVALTDEQAESLQFQLVQDVIQNTAQEEQEDSPPIDLSTDESSLIAEEDELLTAEIEVEAESFDLTEDSEDSFEPQIEAELQIESAEQIEATPLNDTLAPPEVLEILLAQLADAQEQLTTALAEIMTAEEGSETLLMAVATYTENVQSLWEVAEMAGLIGLQEVCTFVNDNIMTLSGATVEQRAIAYDVLATWTELVQAYLQSPTQVVRGLISHLQSQQWPTPLTIEQVEQLQQQLLKSSLPEVPPPDEVIAQSLPLMNQEDHDRSTFNEERNEPADFPPTQKENEAWSRVATQVIEITEQLLSALEVCVSMENDNPALLEAIESYTSQVQMIWDAAETAGLAGLQQVCAFINDNVMAFSLQEPATKLTAQGCFKQWPNAVLEYLHAPTVGAQNLIELLKNSAWPMPLAEENTEEWLALLLQSSTAPEQVTAYQAELEESFETTEIIEETAEKIEADDAAPNDLNLEVGAESGIALGNAEVLEILRTEIESAKEDLTNELTRFMTLTAEDAQLAAENYADILQRLQAAAEMLGLPGLQFVCTFIAENVKTLSNQESTAKNKAKKLLAAWPDEVLAYLSSPETSVIPLINLLREPQWINPLSDEQAYTLLGLLTQGTTQTAEEEAAEEVHRETTARPEDVSLAVPEDINRDLLEAYLQEAPQYAADFSECIQNIIAEPTSAEIQKAKRIAHTLKGSSNIIGIKGIANIGHHLEDILEFFTSHQDVIPPKALTDMMVEAADCLEGMVDALTGQDDAPPQAQQVLQNILDWANRIDRGNLNAPASQPVTATKKEAKVDAVPAVEAVEQPRPAAEKPAKKEKAVATESGTPEQLLKVPTKTIDNLMRLVGELSISIGQIQERLKHVIGSVRQLNQQDLILQRKTFELENIVDVRGITGVESHKPKLLADEEDEDFDPLEFEEYNELHSVSHSFIESIADNRELGLSIRHDLSQLEGMFIHQERLNKEFESVIMTTRMVPVNTIVSKLQRNVRQTCRTTGKQAEIEITGSDILIDSDVLNNLADPLMHILRNSIDHGLETPEDRKLLGKSESGLIKVDFYRQGNNIVVSCRDDGQGLNYTNIRYAAIQRGMIREEQELSEADLARLILMSGFSTKSGVTQVSGRGVGMDVVHTNIRQMKGTLDLHSETGKGMTILIKLPMTLVTVHVLLIRIGSRRFGIPTNHLDQALAPGLGEFQRIGSDLTLKLGKNIYALKSLAALLNVPSDKAEIDEHEKRPIILAREETGVVALVVDELLDGRDLVMKNMGRYVKQVRGVAGASILGDGTVIPLLDLPELLRSPLQAMMGSHVAMPSDAVNPLQQPTSTPHIMIVDDSLSVRKSLSLLIEEAGFETLLAKDGLEAIEVMNQKRPDVMLVDMEMPRMNGLELTAHVRANQTTQNMPIFMITSRTTEKHREQAKSAGVSAYLNKPYQDVELLSLIDKALAGHLPARMV